MAIPYSRMIFGSLPWYSVLVVSGIAAAIWLASKEEKRFGLPADTAIDLALLVVPLGIIGARLYYVLMRWDVFATDPIKALYVWEGGLAIYGGVIGGAAGVLAYAWRKKLPFAVLADLVAPGLLLAQAIGRWGNYFNMEAYGPEITNPVLQFFPAAILIPGPEGAVWHAATFFYESIWNLTGFFALWVMRRKKRAQGSIFAWYLLIYGSGRFAIEQLRQDSLYIGSLRASQVLSLILCVAAIVWLLKTASRNTKSSFVAAGMCGALWVLRWLMLPQPAVYAVTLVAAGIASLWYARNRKRALLWLLAAVMADGMGLLAAVMQRPLSAAFADVLHSFVCSASLPVSIYALSTDDQ